MPRFQVRLGEEFEVSTVTVETPALVAAVSKADLARRAERMRGYLAIACVATLIVFLLVAGIIGIRTSDFRYLGAVWDAGALPLGFVLRSYFDRK